MDIDEYQINASKTAIYPEDSKVIYPALGLAGEAGEVSNKIKKTLRGDISIEDIRHDLIHEIGDVLWYVSALCSDLNIRMSSVAQMNLDKLNNRLQNDMLGGSSMREKAKEQEDTVAYLKKRVIELETRIRNSLRHP